MAIHTGGSSRKNHPFTGVSAATAKLRNAKDKIDLFHISSYIPFITGGLDSHGYLYVVQCNFSFKGTNRSVLLSQFSVFSLINILL